MRILVQGRTRSPDSEAAHLALALVRANTVSDVALAPHDGEVGLSAARHLVRSMDKPDVQILVGVSGSARKGAYTVAYPGMNGTSCPGVSLSLSSASSGGVGVGIAKDFLVPKGPCYRHGHRLVYVDCASAWKDAIAAAGAALRTNKALTFTLAKTSPQIRELVQRFGLSHRVRYDTRSYDPQNLARVLSMHCAVMTDLPQLALRGAGLDLPVVTLRDAGRLLPVNAFPALSPAEATAVLVQIDSKSTVATARASGSAVRSSCQWGLVASRILSRLPCPLPSGALKAANSVQGKPAPSMDADTAVSPRVATVARRPRIGLMHDGATWAFSRIAKQMKIQLEPWADVVIGSLADPLNPDRMDAVVLIWWKSIHAVCSRLPVKTRIYPCLYDYFTWTGWRQHNHLSNLVARSDGLIFASCDDLSQRLIREKVAKEAITLTDGVDPSMFVAHPRPADDVQRDLVVGWVGNPRRHGKLKGLGLIRRAIKQVKGVRLVEANALHSPVPFEQMPAFYAGLDAVIVGSTSEGTPNPLLEGMSAGRVVLSTDVGVSPMIQSPGLRRINSRTVDGIASALNDLLDNRAQLDAWGAANRREVEERWTWERRLEPFVSRLRTDLRNLPAAAPRSPVPEAPKAVVIPVTTRPATEKPRALLISDVRAWAFHQNMSDLEAHLKGRFSFDHFFVMDYQNGTPLPDLSRYDSIFCCYHRWPVCPHLPMDRTVGSLRALWFWPESPGPPGPREYALVNSYKAFHVVTKQNYQELEPHCPGVVYLTNPVNMARFPTPTPVEGEVIASWNGNAQHYNIAGQDVKGYSSCLVPACQAAGVPLHVAEYNTSRKSPAQMPAFYGQANLSVCASLYEGASNSVMESMAAGLAVVATDVGNHREMRDAQLADFGESGIILLSSRAPATIAKALTWLKRDPARVKAMGLVNRAEIEKRWSWAVWRDRYATFLEAAL